LAVTKATRLVIVDHADSLHKGIADGRADKFEAALQQIFAERVGDFRASSKGSVGSAFQRLAVYEAPDVFIKAAEFALHCEKSDGVADRGVDLELIADDAVVRQQRCDLTLIVLCDFLRVEAVECGAIVIAFSEDGFPAKTGLSSFENQKLKETVVVVNRHAPFFVVIGD